MSDPEVLELAHDLNNLSALETLYEEGITDQTEILEKSEYGERKEAILSRDLRKLEKKNLIAEVERGEYCLTFDGKEYAREIFGEKEDDSVEHLLTGGPEYH